MDQDGRRNARATMYAASVEREAFLGLCAALRCPVLIIEGDRDAISGPPGIELARSTGRTVAVLEGGGHGPNGRCILSGSTSLIRAFVRDLVPVAVEPAETGVVERPDGVRIAYEVFGAGRARSVSRRRPRSSTHASEAQVPYLSLA